jgi:hypothetical protein
MAVTIRYRKSGLFSKSEANDVEQLAKTTGLSEAMLIGFFYALGRGLPVNAATKLVWKCSDILLAKFTPTNFPLDVTAWLFKTIKGTPDLFLIYVDATTTNGVTDPVKVAAVHGDLGRMVKLALGAEKVGRSNALDPATHLIKSHALLAPKPPQPQPTP